MEGSRKETQKLPRFLLCLEVIVFLFKSYNLCKYEFRFKSSSFSFETFVYQSCKWLSFDLTLQARTHVRSMATATDYIVGIDLGTTTSCVSIMEVIDDSL